MQETLEISESTRRRLQKLASKRGATFETLLKEALDAGIQQLEHAYSPQPKLEQLREELAKIGFLTDEEAEEMRRVIRESKGEWERDRRF